MKWLCTFLIYAAWHQIYPIVSNSDSFYEDLLELKANPKDVPTLVSTVVLIKEWFSGKLSHLLPHFFLHYCLTTQTEAEDTLQKCTSPLYSVNIEELS